MIFHRLLLTLTITIPLVARQVEAATDAIDTSPQPMTATDTRVCIDGVNYEVTNASTCAIVESPDAKGSITIPKTVNIGGKNYRVTAIADKSFYYCFDITDVTIPEGVTTIGDAAFFWCWGLTNVTIPEGVTSIGKCAFIKCEALTNISIPESLTTIGQSAFSGCEALNAINVAPANTTFRSIDGVLFNHDGTTLLRYPEGKEATKYIIPQGVTAIGESAFDRCGALATITLPDGITTIGRSAFSGCENLKTVTLPEGLTTIDKWAFSSCGFTSVTLPECVFTINEKAFVGCKNLTTINIPANAISVEKGIFYNCPNLKNIAYPDHLNIIYDSWFEK